MIGHSDRTSFLRATFHGSFANITSKALRAWFARDEMIHLRDRHGNTHLHRAVTEGAKPFVVSFLIARGVDKNAVNEAGENALVLAERHGRNDLVEAISKKATRPRATSRKEVSLPDAASANYNSPVVKTTMADREKSKQEMDESPATAAMTEKEPCRQEVVEHLNAIAQGLQAAQVELAQFVLRTVFDDNLSAVFSLGIREKCHLTGLCRNARSFSGKKKAALETIR